MIKRRPFEFSFARSMQSNSIVGNMRRGDRDFHISFPLTQVGFIKITWNLLLCGKSILLSEFVHWFNQHHIVMSFLYYFTAGSLPSIASIYKQHWQASVSVAVMVRWRFESKPIFWESHKPDTHSSATLALPPKNTRLANKSTTFLNMPFLQ